MDIRIGTELQAKVIAIDEYGYLVETHGCHFYAKSKEPLNVGDIVIIKFKSFVIGCFWEARPISIPDQF